MIASETKCLLKNLGFDQEFFEKVEKEVCIIKKSALRKIFSESAVVKLQEDDPNLQKRKCREEEDIDLYQEADSQWDMEEEDTFQYGTRVVQQETNLFSENDTKKVESLPEVNLKIFQNCSRDQMNHLQEIFSNMNSGKEEKKIIRAYKSKLKTKYYDVYEYNSKQFLEKIKDKIFHKCHFPNCGRTFASSGWLKAHFSDHMKELKKNKFNILFEHFQRIVSPIEGRN